MSSHSVDLLFVYVTYAMMMMMMMIIIIIIIIIGCNSPMRT